jgi:glycosyltransferase involved in cell wall biosynthesis
VAKIGVVAIGRNEGDRLRRCLKSIGNQASAVVYVDSGSTDGSVELARSLGVETVLLDLSIPFTAARARNEGFDRLLQICPNVELVQFVDGDCEVIANWLDRAERELVARLDVAVVCGRRRERFPDASIYNQLCDLEWNTPLGETDACGGDALMRVGPLRQTGGYRASLIAGEEPELCLRLRSAGWKILRIDTDMTLHDAAMTHFGQWWKRAVRAGHAFAEVSWLHRAGPLRLWARETRSNWFWGLVLPALALLLAGCTKGFSLLLLLGYPFLAFRVYRNRRRRGDGARLARQYAFFTVLGKFAHMAGQARYHWNRLLSRPSALIEYKQAATAIYGPRAMRVAYLVNQYPHVSHSFIRREIIALEMLGIPVDRFSVRSSSADLVDPADRAERQRTQVILDVGILGILEGLLWTAISRPLSLVQAFGVTLRLGRRSERGILRHFVYLAEACVLLDRLHHCGARHLHAHFGTNSASVAMLTYVLGGPTYSFTVHGPEEFDKPENLSLGEKIERAAFVIAISHFGRSQLYRWCSYAHWPKINVVHCGVDAAFLSGGPQTLLDTPRLVCVGRLSEQKGQLLILDALARLLAEGIPFEMVLAGDGPMRSVIEKQIQSLGLNKHVRITGWLSNDAVRRELLAARAMVLPSFAEGLPVVIMEALALGRPVVTTYVAGIPELVEEGVSGWLIPAGSVSDLAGALRRVLQTPISELTKMGHAGADRTAAQHDVMREAEKLAALFKQVAGVVTVDQPAAKSVG